MTDRSVMTEHERLCYKCRELEKARRDWRFAFWLLFTLMLIVLGLSTAHATEWVYNCERVYYWKYTVDTKPKKSELVCQWMPNADMERYNLLQMKKKGTEWEVSFSLFLAR